MYNSPVQTIKTDSLGNVIKKIDKTNNKTTLVSDETRV
jgi:hypothetical protein